MSASTKRVVDGSAILMINAPMCEDVGCPSRTNCYRHAAAGRLPRTGGQPYFAEPTRSPDDNSCSWYWPLKVPGVARPKIRHVSVVQSYTIKNDPGQIKTFIDRKEVARILGVQPATIVRLMKRPDSDFPKPLRLGQKITQWVRSEIMDFLKSDENRGISVIGGNRRSWRGGTESNPAHPWIW